MNAEPVETGVEGMTIVGVYHQFHHFECPRVSVLQQNKHHKRSS